jgi:natural resistance-associated macrophage protein
LTLYSAADALSESFGSRAKYLWAVGLLAAGQSATMTGTYAGQFNTEGFLDWHIPVWIRVLGSRIVGIVPTVYVSLYGPEALVILDEWLNAI